MRKHWLGFVTLLVTVGCAHEGKLRPQVGAVPLSEDGTAAVTGAQGVRLVAYGSNWKGTPGDLERHFTPVQIRLENHSGRPLSIQYKGFELAAKDVYVARSPQDLGDILSTRATRFRPARPAYVVPPTSPNRLDNQATREAGPTYTGRGYEVAPFNPVPCHTCPNLFAASAVPSPDMLQQALPEGPLENGQGREGFLYFEQPLLGVDRAILKVKLVDASTGEQFGTLSVPFEVR
jgi:hypothetical protein